MLVVSEIFGVHEHIADVARRFAKQATSRSRPSCSCARATRKRRRDLQARWPKSSQGARRAGDGRPRRGVAWAKATEAIRRAWAFTGFCWGGRITWLYDARNPDIKAAVAWYGRLVGDSTPLTPKHPVDLVGQLHGPVLGLYGGADPGIPLDTIEKMKAALANGSAAAKKSEFVVYPDTPHAFNADYRPSYRKAAAEDGWKRCLAWLKAHGVA
jgi:carboxymethylenebutenolidase